MKTPIVRAALAMAASLALAASPAPLAAQSPAGATFDDSLPSGANYALATFRLWIPNDAGQIRAALILVPGSNGDGRGEVSDTVWQNFAVKHHVALVGVQLTDKPHDQGFIEEYADVARGSGQALLDALGDFAKTSHHAELAGAPLLLWGMSAGGEFNYEFNAWKPERVIAFVVNKGNIYYHALVSRAARQVPGLLFTGGKDLEYRINTIKGLFAVNRRGAALWAWAEEPGVAHVVGESRDVALDFFEDLLPMRLGDVAPSADGSMALRPLDEHAGVLGDYSTLTFKPMGAGRAPGVPTAWLPTERVALAWQAMVSGH